MPQDSFRSVVCRSLSKSHPSSSRSKDGSYPEGIQCDAPYVVTLQPTVCRSCQSQDWRPSQSNREGRSILSQRDYVMGSTLSRHFAEDLLRGAMDLQDSLVMLEKFQTVSQSMRQSTKQRRPGNGEESLDVSGIREALFEASIAKKLVPGSVSSRFDGQLRNSTDELKRVIKDSLYRAKLLSVSSNGEQLASLSQSSRSTPNSTAVSKSTKEKKVVPRSSSCPPVQPDKSKSPSLVPTNKTPSLVARLMGLEGLPPHNGNTAKKDETLKTVSSPRAQFDIDMPRSKPTPAEKLPRQSLGKDSQRKGKAGQEMMKTIQVKRLLNTMNSDEHKVQQRNLQMNFPYFHEDTLPSQDTSAATEVASVKSIQREQRMGQAQTKAPKDVKVVSHRTRKQHIEKTEINSRSSNKQKYHFADRKGERRKDVKAKTASASHTNAKLVKKTDKKSVASSSNPSTCRTMKPVLRRTPGSSIEKIVSSRNVNNSTLDDIVAYEVHREFIQTDCPSTEHSATPSDESCQSADWDTEPSIDDAQEDFSGCSEASLISSQSSPPINRTPKKEVEIKDEMNLLLLSSKSFVNQAAQLIGIDAYDYDHLIEQYKDTGKAEMGDRELYMDIAMEQLEQKHRQGISLYYTGFRTQKCGATPYFSLEALLGDISDGTRELKSYTDDKDDHGSGTKDSMSMKLERDLGCADVSINSVWDMGWQDWICMEETECWVRDVEESVLSLLIEEVALEMLAN
ncbi:hypothetical protein CFC21_046723 [Triticum aestivum]|nr:uncharacterized protein LOC109738576 [Aegilops tauschii subsp. strangulata]XP_020153258.1 uncharacterized protein LOC109738576 [Aegilops tauschii subsp. strangulata]XP_020153259.1 uncharacterized protein LOC109738576 [Aegilops tauschii subsp. strangulata]XP_020153260.1 uncharacterized protein LOC109738576 [Aegilops tauschii subsp. strangulata]XP_020153261.1 uncharacterized protein LOC109738576 [Aegilops tauschii subsp. strangulata]XP_044356133.1 uncharacterized protein LOC123077866 [Triticu